MPGQLLSSLLALRGRAPHHDLTRLDGLLTANKVARKFEFTPLRQRGLQEPLPVPESAVKS
jgi:hypothetical protein